VGLQKAREPEPREDHQDEATDHREVDAELAVGEERAEDEDRIYAVGELGDGSS
jgi:hypothetical protein